ncbi:hypothetical protein E4U41_003163, partial [Claviceps citrina]
EGFAASLNPEARAAARAFEEAMGALSADVAARAFDGRGLCRGAPFIWRALDPNVALFSMTI